MLTLGRRPVGVIISLKDFRERFALERALALSGDIRMGGYDALYLAHTESLGLPWLTADIKVIRRLKGDPSVQPLVV